MVLDGIVQLSVISRSLAEVPADPSDGDRYIVAADAVDEWAGWDLAVALRQDGGWTRLTPAEGWLAWVRDESLLLAWNGSDWTAVPGDGSDGAFAAVGVDATVDPANRLAVKAEEVFFSMTTSCRATAAFASR